MQQAEKRKHYELQCGVVAVVRWERECVEGEGKGEGRKPACARCQCACLHACASHARTFN